MLGTGFFSKLALRWHLKPCQGAIIKLQISQAVYMAGVLYVCTLVYMYGYMDIWIYECRYLTRPFRESFWRDE